jgi:flavin reductase (DIM6/NTAB) family NADH-FMN oxidoreductase RutF
MFRAAMGRFATGVTVISVKDDEGTHAMTANGFLSVSLEPMLILVSIGVQARMHGRLMAAGRYGVSVLGAGNEAASRHFSGRPSVDLEPEFTEVAGVPVLTGVVAVAVASIVDAHPAGDHTLFIGQVEALDFATGDPLLFYGGAYRGLARPTRALDYTEIWGPAGIDAIG